MKLRQKKGNEFWLKFARARAKVTDNKGLEIYTNVLTIKKLYRAVAKLKRKLITGNSNVGIYDDGSIYAKLG